MKDGKWRAERGIKESDIGLGQLWRVRRPVRDWTTVYIFQEWQWRYSFYMQTILYNYNQAFRYLVIFPNKSFQKVNKMSCNKNIKNTQHLFLFLAKKKKTKKKKKQCFQRKNDLIFKWTNFGSFIIWIWKITLGDFWPKTKWQILKSLS